MRNSTLTVSELLPRLPLFAGLTREQLTVIVSGSHVRTVRENFGEVVFDGISCPVTAPALVETKLLSVPSTAALSLMDLNPSYTRRMPADMAVRLLSPVRDVESYALRTSEPRVPRAESGGRSPGSCCTRPGGEGEGREVVLPPPSRPSPPARPHPQAPLPRPGRRGRRGGRVHPVRRVHHADQRQLQPDPFRRAAPGGRSRTGGSGQVTRQPRASTAWSRSGCPDRPSGAPRRTWTDCRRRPRTSAWMPASTRSARTSSACARCTCTPSRASAPTPTTPTSSASTARRCSPAWRTAWPTWRASPRTSTSCWSGRSASATSTSRSWSCSMPPTPARTAPSSPPLCGQLPWRARRSWSAATICATWPPCWSRRRTPASTSTRTARCCPRTPTRC
ncbi:hypothetical protein a10_01583 [Streptomyces acidiscabies]|nr:hypothetical protein a10_01583 [Streptomyces acidiscabies]GAV37716.1 hypothetical protein Saa2_00590 [Streptomyces acidiscabies]